MKNKQPPEQPVHGRDWELDVHSIFPTTQGEGPYAGWPCVFVRLAGCNLQCPGCDTEYTAGRKRRRLEDVVNTCSALAPFIYHSKKRLVVITGGEPFRQPEALGEFCKLLLSCGFLVQVETNGTLPPPDNFAEAVLIVLSPKTAKVNNAMLNRANVFKYVLRAGYVCDEDGLPTSALEAKYPPHRPADKPVYVQPYDEHDAVANQANVQAAVESAMKHGYLFGLQVHKYAKLP